MKSFFGIKLCVFLRFSRIRQDGSAPNFFQDLGEDTCSLQPATTCIEKQCTRPLKKHHQCL